VLVVACYGYYKKQTHPRSAVAAAPHAAKPKTAAKTGTSQTDPKTTAEKPIPVPVREYEDFAVIPKRNLFKSLIKEETPVRKSTPKLPPPPGPLPPETGSSSSTSHDVIAVTGAMTVGDVQVALVENVTKKETKLARVGTEAFGYVVASVDSQGAVLRKDGEDHYFSLGANKPEEKAAKEEKKKEETKKPEEKKPETPPTPSAPPSFSRGFDFRNLTPAQREEFRRRWEARRRHFGGIRR